MELAALLLGTSHEKFVHQSLELERALLHNRNICNRRYGPVGPLQVTSTTTWHSYEWAACREQQFAKPLQWKLLALNKVSAGGTVEQISTMATACKVHSSTCVQGLRTALHAPFRSHISKRRLTVACHGSNSQRSSTDELQTLRPSTSSSPAMFLARNVLQSAGQGAREILASPCSLVAAAALIVYLLPTDAASAADAAHHHQPLYTVAEGGGEEFWSNVARYVRYFFSVLLGTAYTAVKPLADAFKRPTSAILAISLIIGGSVLLRFTLNAMLGIEEPFVYEPGNLVPYSP